MGISRIHDDMILDVNGSCQYLWARGSRPENPLLLVVHGGPGTPLMPFHRDYFSVLEDVTTVVQWDQRGTGKSFVPDADTRSMRIDQFVEDIRSVAEQLLTRYSKKQLIVWGTSWGSMIAVLAVRRYPELFSCYIGTGQNVDLPTGERVSYEFTLRRATEEQNQSAIRSLGQIHPPYERLEDLKVHREWLMRFGGFLRKNHNINLIFSKAFFRSRDVYSMADVFRFFRGQDFSVRSLWREADQVNLMAEDIFDMPVYFLEGRYDYQCPTSIAEAYFKKIQAPKKSLTWFEGSAHMPYIEEPQAYFETLRKIIAEQSVI